MGQDNNPIQILKERYSKDALQLDEPFEDEDKSAASLYPQCDS